MHQVEWLNIMNKERVVDKSIIAACIAAIGAGIFWLVVHKPKVWEIVYSLALIIGLFYCISNAFYDDYRSRLPWRKKSGERREPLETMLERRLCNANKERVIDTSIITACTFFVVWGGLWLGFHKPVVLAWLVLAVGLYFITGLVYGVLEGRLPWRKNEEEHHE